MDQPVAATPENTRSRKKPKKPELGQVSILEKLVLAQAVWEVGPGSWLKISRILGKHPLLSHMKKSFTAQSCHAVYKHIMNEAGFELSDANHAIHAPTHLKLAEKYHAERIDELRTLIGNEEDSFRTIVGEINQIQAGQRDEEIKAKITGIPIPQHETEVAVAKTQTISPEQDVPADATASIPSDGVPEVETIAEPEPREQDHVHSADPIEPSSSLKAKTENVEIQPEDAIATSLVEEVPPEVHSSPVENLDHLMQASDEEMSDKVQHNEIPEPIEQSTVANIAEEILGGAPEDETTQMDIAEPSVDDVKKVETQETQFDQDMDQTQSKPVSHHSEAADSNPTDETISTRRSTRRRPSVSSAPAPVPAPAPGRKRGRRPQQKSSPGPEAEAEQESTPVPSVKEATPAVDETQPEEEMPLLSAAMRRRETGKRKASVLGGLESPRDRKRAREESEPVDEDQQGSTPTALRRRPTGRTEEQVALKRFQTVITMVHTQISQHRNGNIFHNPIKPSEAPDYHDIVKRPIDLKTIKAKIKDGVIGNSLEYQRDIYLMFANAMMYNRPGSDVHVMAEDMMVESDTYINTFRQTEGYVYRR
ncbi:hypothetical protein C8R43DRAFT_971916 [Mycena crocata]|nr:hypothetical protein C8R43DRAFT_971916 [Mycena crocata]